MSAPWKGIHVWWSAGVLHLGLGGLGPKTFGHQHSLEAPEKGNTPVGCCWRKGCTTLGRKKRGRGAGHSKKASRHCGQDYKTTSPPRSHAHSTLPVLGKRARGQTWETVTHLIGEMTAVDDQPFSLVEDVAVLRLTHHVAAWYNIPSRRTMSQ